MSDKQILGQEVLRSAKLGIPRSIVIPKDLTTAELHDKIERHIAKRRMEGVTLTKPQAVVELVSIALTRI